MTLEASSQSSVFKFHSRYLKDASFENYGAPLQTENEPEININTQVSGVSSDNLFEITSVAEDELYWFLYVTAPDLLFVHAQRVIADLIRDGGFPNLSLATPDFATIWKLKSNDPKNADLMLPDNITTGD